MNKRFYTRYQRVTVLFRMYLIFGLLLFSACWTVLGLMTSLTTVEYKTNVRFENSDDLFENLCLGSPSRKSAIQTQIDYGGRNVKGIVQVLYFCSVYIAVVYHSVRSQRFAGLLWEWVKHSTLWLDCSLVSVCFSGISLFMLRIWPC